MMQNTCLSICFFSYLYTPASPTPAAAARHVRMRRAAGRRRRWRRLRTATPPVSAMFGPLPDAGAAPSAPLALGLLFAFGHLDESWLSTSLLQQSGIRPSATVCENGASK